MEITINEIDFEWDDEKAEINLRKHKVSFEEAVQVFFDDDRLERLDDFHSGCETRWQVIGKVRDVLFVVYTERRESKRIISISIRGINKL